jgi:hypothetical protein
MESGVIKGNHAFGGTSHTTTYGGGGVWINRHSNTFIKKGGTIYGDADTDQTPGSDENTATNGKGHVVYVASPPAKQRNSDAGPEVKLYASSVDNGTTWTFEDTSTGGVGDTSGNWQ